MEVKADAWRRVLKLFKTVRLPPPRPSFSTSRAAAAATSTAAAATATTTGAAPPSKEGTASQQKEEGHEQEEEQEEDMCCSICLEPLGLTPAAAATRRVVAPLPVCALPCSHRFHRKCITECVKQGHGNCPNCRYDLFANAPAAGSGVPASLSSID